MILRGLNDKDAPLMLEWQHDDDITECLVSEYTNNTLQDCERFIKASDEVALNLHMAIASDTDEYMGTVSLKNINNKTNSAELAIVMRKKAWGKGYSSFGMNGILRIAFDKLGLESVYWCVLARNRRACRFYDKNCFQTALDISNDILARYEGVDGLKWYKILKHEYYENFAKEHAVVEHCKMIKINTISTQNTGDISFFEANRDIPFDIKRIYYISKVPEGMKRGFHAHKELKQFLFCPYGKIQLVLDNGVRRQDIMLADPSVGILLEKPIWREMLWLKEDSVLCVAVSDYYSEHDYIRDYSEFLEFQRMRGEK